MKKRPKELTKPFEQREGSRYPRSTREMHNREINTQRFAAGSRDGTTAGQGPALDSK